MFAIDPVKRKTPTTGGGTGVQFLFSIDVRRSCYYLQHYHNTYGLQNPHW